MPSAVRSQPPGIEAIVDIRAGSHENPTMQVTIDLDPAVYKAFEHQARTEHTTLSGVIARLLIRLNPSSAAPETLSEDEQRLTNGELRYQIPVSPGSRSFTSEDVARLEAEDDFR
jgi:hypothetical protein